MELEFIVLKKDPKHTIYPSWKEAETEADRLSKLHGGTYIIAKIMHEVEEDSKEI